MQIFTTEKNNVKIRNVLYIIQENMQKSIV